MSDSVKKYHEMIQDGLISPDRKLEVAGNLKAVDISGTNIQFSGELLGPAGNSVISGLVAGPQGTQGHTGYRGAQGYIGTQGEQGAPWLGATGVAGAQGATGPYGILDGDQEISGIKTFLDNVIVSGSLTVDGSTVFLDSETLIVEDKNIVLGKVTTPSDTTANGGGITLLGDEGSEKNILYSDTNKTWEFSENMDISNNKAYRINNVDVLKSTSLGLLAVDVTLNAPGFPAVSTS